MLYANAECEVATDAIIKRAYDFGKIVVLPTFDAAKFTMTPMKVDKSGKGPGYRRAGDTGTGSGQMQNGSL